MEQAVNEMNESPNERENLKKYLLGILTDKKEMHLIEEKSLLDDDYDERLLIAEDELVEEYLDGTLTETERRQFQRFFLASAERKEKLRLIKDLRKYAVGDAGVQKVKESSKEKKSWFDWRGLFAQPALRFAALALVVCGLSFTVWRVAIYQSDVDKGLAQLRLAYRGQRPTESRTTANFQYAPVTVTRGNATPAVTDDLARRSAENHLIDAARQKPGSESHHALGLLFLAEKNFDQALENFNLALNLTPDDAGLNTDIGAVYLEKAAQAEEKKDSGEKQKNLARALKHFDRALEINPALPEALFNRALTLQKMPVENEARRAWEKYLEKDSTSEWAGEARRNLEKLNQLQSRMPKDNLRILQDFLDAFHQRDDARAWEIASQTKELITDVMIQHQLTQRFMEASRQSRKEEVEEILSAFLYLGELEKQKAGDLYFAELARYYASTNPERQQKLGAAHAEMQNGYGLIKKQEWKSAIETFEQAKNLFLAAGNDWEAQIAEYQICYCLCQNEEIAKSNERLFALAEISTQKNHKWVQALADGWMGSNYVRLGEYSKAINHSEKSLKTAREISDTYNIQRALNQLAHAYWLIGDTDRTLSLISDSLNFSDLYYQSPRQQQRNLLFATEGFYRLKFYEAAAAFGGEEALFAQATNDRWLNHTAYTHLAMIFGKAGKYAEAFQAVESAFAIVNSFADEKMRRNQNALTRLILAHLQRESNNCGEAVNNYNQAIADYESAARKYEARKGRLLCFVALKNDAAVSEEMPALLKIFDANRKQISEESDRNTFFDNEQSVYDIATDYSYARLGNVEQAFNYAENSRARSLLDLIKNNQAPTVETTQNNSPPPASDAAENAQTQPLALADIRQKMPPGAQILYYAALADKILIWQISATSFNVEEKSIKASDLNEKIQKYRNLLLAKTGDDEINGAARELYQLLIQPIENRIEPDKALCVIADKTLLYIPFAALVSPQTGRYLVEDYTVFYAPSATIFINETENARQRKPSGSETILSVGNPSFSNKEYLELKDLPDAAREAQQISLLYNSPKPFVGDQAVKEQIAASLPEVNIFHFAGHYVSNEKSHSLSKLLLASGELSVEEIMQKKLPQMNLMILSACETGVEKFYNGEGMIGAARSFLAAGVPLIVASQWSVDSDSTAELMIKFHGYRKRQKMSTIAALRQAQIDMLKSETPHYRQPYYWAGFLPIGGYAEY